MPKPELKAINNESLLVYQTICDELQKTLEEKKIYQQDDERRSCLNSHIVDSKNIYYIVYPPGPVPFRPNATEGTDGLIHIWIRSTKFNSARVEEWVLMADIFIAKTSIKFQYIDMANRWSSLVDRTTDVLDYGDPSCFNKIADRIDNLLPYYV